MDSQPTIHAAVSLGQVDRLRQLLEDGVNPNLPNDRDQTPLHLAASAGDKDAIELLVAHGAKVNMHDWFGQNPLAIAVSGGHAEAVDFLLDNLAAANWKEGSSGRTLLHLSVIGPSVPNVGVMRSLLDAGVKLGATDSYGLTALDHAIDRRRADAVEFLLQAGALKHLSVDEALREAIRSGNSDAARLFIDEYGADPNLSYEKWVTWFGGSEGLYSQSPLHLAAENGNLETVKLLLSREADPNALSSVGSPPLYIALANLTREDAHAVAEALLEGGADPNLVSLSPHKSISPETLDLLNSYRDPR